MDYIFRRLALDHLPYEQRAELGILTADERTAQLNGEGPGSAGDDLDPEELAQSVSVERVRAEPKATEPTAAESKVAEPRATESTTEAHRSAQQRAARAATPPSSTELIESQQGRVADAPLCLTCGTKMRPAGSCYVCEGCGSTSGCS
jgi:ribonucleoside-diphosphate reductase alpha chain